MNRKSIRQGNGKTLAQLRKKVKNETKKKNLIKKTLIPYDATQSSEKALKKILPVLEKHSGKIVLLTCIKDKATFGFFQTKSDKKALKIEKEKAQKFHKTIKRIIEELGIRFISKIVKSDLESHTIIEYAKKEKVDLIVMSKSKLKTNAEKIYHDSTVDAVFKKTPCPFLYIP